MSHDVDSHYGEANDTEKENECLTNIVSPQLGFIEGLDAFQRFKDERRKEDNKDLI